MKRFLVEYRVVHKKEFWVRDKSQITDILNQYNQCEVLNIEELPSDFSGPKED